MSILGLHGSFLHLAPNPAVNLCQIGAVDKILFFFFFCVVCHDLFALCVIGRLYSMLVATLVITFSTIFHWVSPKSIPASLRKKWTIRFHITMHIIRSKL